MERRSEKRKWLARERQHQHRQRIKVSTEAIEQVKQEDCTQYGNEWLSNQVHVQEQNCKQFQRCCANMTEEQQQEEQGHDCSQHANQQLSPGHEPGLTTSAFHVGQGIKVSNLAMEIRSQERKRLARERQHHHVFSFYHGSIWIALFYL